MSVIVHISFKFYDNFHIICSLYSFLITPILRFCIPYTCFFSVQIVLQIENDIREVNDIVPFKEKRSILSFGNLTCLLYYSFCELQNSY